MPKRLLLIYFVAVWTLNHQYAQVTSTSDLPAEETEYLRFDIDSYDLGKVKKGDRVSFDINFTNLSDTLVYIDFISACECTEIDYPKSGIKPKTKGVLKVTFDSKDKDVSETTDIDVFIKNRDSETGSQIYYTLEYSFELLK
jgi:hypothetical protein